MIEIDVRHQSIQIFHINQNVQILAQFDNHRVVVRDPAQGPPDPDRKVYQNHHRDVHAQGRLHQMFQIVHEAHQLNQENQKVSPVRQALNRRWKMVLPSVLVVAVHNHPH